jgi:hypothetical protein
MRQGLLGWSRPTVCLSAAASASPTPVKNQRSRARSGRLHRRVRRPGRDRSLATRMRRPHHPGITPCTTGLNRNHAHLVSREAQRVLIWNHAPLESHFPQRAFRTTGVRTTLCTTSFQHNGPAYHACTTGIRTTEIAQRAARKPDSPHPKRKGNDNCAATGAERAAHQLRPRCAHKTTSKTNDLARRRRSAAWAC